MRVAALYDIHGNQPALEAVLDDVRRAAVDMIVVGGDVLPGPMPTENLETLRDLEIPILCIQGNGERGVLEFRAGVDSDMVPEAFHDMMRWVGAQLSAEQVELLGGWPRTLRLDIDGLGQVLFCHATHRSDTELFTRLTPAERLFPVFESVEASHLICGDTHMQFERTVGDLRVVNAGSVGMPFGDPGAYWLLLGPEVELRRTDYDLDAGAARVRATEYPSADEFASINILKPPTEAEMLERFESAALR